MMFYSRAGKVNLEWAAVQLAEFRSIVLNPSDKIAYTVHRSNNHFLFLRMEINCDNMERD